MCMFIFNSKIKEKCIINKKKTLDKRVDIVSLKLVKESSVLYETRKINRPIDYEKDNEYKRCCPTDELWKLPVVIACTLFLHIH